MGELFTRSYGLDGIQIRSGGDGRTVEAYAAVFDTEAEIRDQQGHYIEVISRTAFDEALRDRRVPIGVFYNHAKTMHGTPSELGSVPLGKPLQVRADIKGVLTVTRYNKSELADAVLEAIRNGDITGQSFSGKFLESIPQARSYRAGRDGQPPRVVRTRIDLAEYGPTPIPAYATASVVGVRAQRTTGLRDEDRERITRMLGV